MIDCRTCKNAFDCAVFSDNPRQFSVEQCQNYEPNNVSIIKDSGNRTEFSTGAVRDMHSGKGRMDLLPWSAIIDVSKHCEQGAEKYGEHNVDRGIPLHSLLDSAARHLAKVFIGMGDEPHLRAATWNLLWALEMYHTHPELIDVPWKEDNNAAEQ